MALPFAGVSQTEAWLSWVSSMLCKEPLMLPKVGVANINARFVAIVASSQHQEAKARQFLAIVDVKTLLAARRNA